MHGAEGSWRRRPCDTIDVETADELEIVPANAAACDDLQTVFGPRGMGRLCQCQRYKLASGESFRSFPLEERRRRLWDQTDCGNPQSGTTSGLLAYLESEPVGWCAVEPRPEYVGLVRAGRVPWDGRDEDRTDLGVWAVTCFFTRAGFRKRGIAGTLLTAAVDHARINGARALEGYPMTTTQAIAEELHVGTHSMFSKAGFVEVSRPTKRRAVMRTEPTR